MEGYSPARRSAITPPGTNWSRTRSGLPHRANTMLLRKSNGDGCSAANGLS